MMKKIAISCGVLTLLLYGQTQSDKESEERNKCVSVGESGALVCHNGTLDVVTAVVPRLTHANRFVGINAFARGVRIDTNEQPRPDCQEELRGTFWFKKNDQKDEMQVCVHDGKSYQWEELEMKAK